MLLLPLTAHANGLVEVIDRKGNVITSANDSLETNLGSGIFYRGKADSDNPLAPTYDGDLMDEKGRKIQVAIPDHYTLTGAYIPKSASEKQNTSNPDKGSSTLPPGSLLQLHSKRGYGFYDLAGNIVLECKYNIGEPFRGYYPVFDTVHPESPSALEFIFNAKKRRMELAPHNIKNCGPPGLLRTITDCNGRQGYMRYDGKLIVAPIFQSTQPLSLNGVAYAKRHTRDSERVCLDSEGREISPDMTTFPRNVKILKPLTKTELLVEEERNHVLRVVDLKGKTLFYLPPGASDMIPTGKGTYFCTVPSREPAERKVICIDATGKILSQTPGELMGPSKFGMQVLAVTVPGKRKRWKVIDTNGRLVIPEQRHRLYVLSEDRLSRVKEEVRRFDKQGWNGRFSTNGSIYSNRQEEFKNLLHEYNLIGMGLGQLRELLGTSHSLQKDLIRFSFQGPGTTCGCSDHGVEIKVIDNHVAAWRFYWYHTPEINSSSTTVSKWIENDMVFDPDYSGNDQKDRHTLKFMIPKSHSPG